MSSNFAQPGKLIAPEELALMKDVASRGSLGSRMMMKNLTRHRCRLTMSSLTESKHLGIGHHVSLDPAGLDLPGGDH